MSRNILRSSSTSIPPVGGISKDNRLLLRTIHQKASGPFTAGEAALWLAMDIAKTRRFLAYLATRGWLVRVRQGLYTPVPMEAADPSQWREDPWLVACKAFHPCYVAGWSACEHWALTDQIFQELIVITARRTRHRRAQIQGIPIRIKVLPSQKIFGTMPVWRGRVRVLVSDPSRTLVDLLDDPSIGGGIHHVADVLRAYFAGEHRNDAALLAYAFRLGNRAVFKRLGYLVEVVQLHAPDVIRECIIKKSSGWSLLDPSLPAKGRIVRRWNLRINVSSLLPGTPP